MKVKTKKWIRNAIIVFSPFLLNATTIPITAYTNSKLDGERTVVFTSSYQGEGLTPTRPLLDETHYLDFFMYTPITLRQNLKGRHVDWQSNATIERIVQSVQNEKYKNICFIGHGSDSAFWASDGLLSARQFYGLELPDRTGGEYIQHTCRGGEGLTIKDSIFPKGSSGYQADPNIWKLSQWVKAWKELFKSF